MINPEQEYDFPSRARLNFYGFKPPLLDPKEASRIYARIPWPFISLYGSKNWADDAAELFVFHHLITYYGRPYQISFYADKGTIIKEPLSSSRLKARAEKILAPIYQ